MMKWMLAVVMVMAMASPAMAVDLRVLWDENTEPDLAGYRLYQRAEGEAYHMDTPIADVAAPAGSLDLLGFPEDGSTTHWVLTAYDTNGNESGPSNEASYTTSDQTAPNTPNLQGVIEIPIP